MNEKLGICACTLALALGTGCATMGTTTPKTPQHVVTADQLAKEYLSSELLFQEKYNGSYVQLTAKVASIDKKTRVDDPTQPLLNLLTPKEYYEVYLTPKETVNLVTASGAASTSCKLSTEYAGWVRTLHNGYTITVKGDLKVEGGGVGYSTTLSGCQPVAIDDKREETAVAGASKETTSNDKISK
jgi:hypothetical protein